MQIAFQTLSEGVQGGYSALLGLLAPVVPGLFCPGRFSVEPEPLEFVPQDIDRQQRLVGVQQFVEPDGLLPV